MTPSRRLLLVLACVVAAVLVVLLRLRSGPPAAVVPGRSTPDAAPVRRAIAARPPILSSPAIAAPASDMRLAGSLVSRLDGSAVGRAEITFAGQGQSYAVASAPDGTFQFVPPAPGSYQLAAVAAEGFLPFAPTWGDSPLVFTARPGFHVDGVVLRLEPTRPIAVKVTDAHGAPVAAANVRVSIARTGDDGVTQLGGPERTDGRGLAHVSAPVGALVEAARAGFAAVQG